MITRHAADQPAAGFAAVLVEPDADEDVVDAAAGFGAGVAEEDAVDDDEAEPVVDVEEDRESVR